MESVSVVAAHAGVDAEVTHWYVVKAARSVRRMAMLRSWSRRVRLRAAVVNTRGRLV